MLSNPGDLASAGFRVWLHFLKNEAAARDLAAELEANGAPAPIEMSPSLSGFTPLIVSSHRLGGRADAVRGVCSLVLIRRLHERRDLRSTFRIGGGHVHEHADPPHLPSVLRARSERPCRRTPEHTQQFAPPHVQFSS